MPKLCTSCGLTTDDDGNLIVNVDGAWPYTCAEATNGGAVYCDSVTGVLHVDPPPYYREFQGRVQINVGSADPTDAVFGSPDVGSGQDPGIPPATASFVVTNPSSCRPMTLYINHGIEHFLFTVTAPTGVGLQARGDVQPQSRIDISGDGGVLVDVGAHQHWGFEAENGEIFRADSMSNYIDVATSYVLPAGGSCTVKLSGSLYVLAKHQDGGANPGSIRITNWSNACKVRGWAGA